MEGKGGFFREAAAAAGRIADAACQAGAKLTDALFPAGIYCICCGSVIDASRRYSLCDSCIGKLGWNTGNVCEKCGKVLVSALAEDDGSHIQGAGYSGGRRLYSGAYADAVYGERTGRRLCADCRSRTHRFDRGYTCSQYGLYERALVMDLKYRDKSYIAVHIGEIMADRMAVEEEMWDIVTWVPVHTKRLAGRGYDQAELIAAAFAERSGLPAPVRLLERRRETSAMKDLGVSERIANVKDAFAVADEALPRAKQAGAGSGIRGGSAGSESEVGADGDTRDLIRGSSILLIDDIYTTGATLDSCAGVLKEAGASRVDVLTFASGTRSGGR